MEPNTSNSQERGSPFMNSSAVPPAVPPATAPVGNTPVQPDQNMTYMPMPQKNNTFLITSVILVVVLIALGLGLFYYFNNSTKISEQNQIAPVGSSSVSTGDEVVADDASGSNVQSDAQSDSSQLDNSTGISSDLKEEIIKAQIKMYDVMASKDPVAIRKYMSEGMADDKDSLAELKASSDKELLQMAGLIITFGFSDIKSSSEIRNILLDPKTQWTVKDESNVELVFSSKTGTSTLTAKKVNGVWY